MLGNAVEAQGRPPRRQVCHLEIVPRYAVPPACPDSFHASFLGGETGGVALESVGLALHISYLRRGKDPTPKAFAEALE